MSWEKKNDLIEEKILKNILILEDNGITNKHIQKVVQELEQQIRIFPFTNIKDAYQCVLEKKIDIFVIDIILDVSVPGDSSGLKFVDRLRKIDGYAFTPVIFITSLEDAKLYTYEKLHCYSFIEKPFDSEKLKVLIRECLNFPSEVEKRKTLYFRKDGIILAVAREDIVYAESISHIMNIHTVRRDVLKIPYVTLKKLIEEADSTDMIQCSRSTMVNTAFIDNVDMPNQIIRLKEGFGNIDIGIMYKKKLKEIFR